jgi:3-phosphoshikimate 1-carboxyvinyltransferase
MATGPAILGISYQETDDGIIINGQPGTAWGGGLVDSHGDHRIAMSFAMAGLQASAPITIRDCLNVNTSFPNFVSLASGAGLKVQILE